MADPQTKTYDGKISGNILVLGSTAGGKTTFVQELACNSMFGKLKGIHWISQIELSKQREAEIDSCFEPKVEFYQPQDEYDLKKTFTDLENLYKERVEKNKIARSEGSGMGEHVERDSLIVLDDVSGLADKSPSFVTFMTVCRKFGYTLLYVFHETVQSSPRWKDILSQMQIFCVFPSALDLVINYLMKFVTRSGSGRGYVSRQQMWITNFVRALAKKSGYSCFCVDRRPHVLGAARYRSQVENPTVQYCYLNSSTSDKLFDTFISRRREQEDKIEYIIEKQVGEIASGKVYELQTNKDGGADGKRTQTTEQRGSGRPDRIQRGGRRARLRKSYTRTKPGFLVAQRES